MLLTYKRQRLLSNRDTLIMKTHFFLWICLLLSLSACIENKRSALKDEIAEDKQAKEWLQGIWINAEDESIAFKAQGDSIIYPDTMSMSVTFKIIEDTLLLQGNELVKYPIVKQTQHLFWFKNSNGDVVKLVRSEDPNDSYAFNEKKTVTLNQNKLIKKDTVVVYNNERYHAYVQINPTTYKVVKTGYNDEGVEVGTVYYDNIINLTLYHGASRLYGRDFRKSDFKRILPNEFLIQGILTDIHPIGMKSDGFHFGAVVVIPDSPSSYHINLVISNTGKERMFVDEQS